MVLQGTTSVMQNLPGATLTIHDWIRVSYIPTCLINHLVPLWARVDQREFWEFQGDKSISTFQLYVSFVGFDYMWIVSIFFLLINHFVVICGRLLFLCTTVSCHK